MAGSIPPIVRDHVDVHLFPFTGQPGQCLNKKAHRSAPGGSGAGGSVVIITKKLHGIPGGKISISGGKPVKCAFGAGGGKIYNIIYCQHQC